MSIPPYEKSIFINCPFDDEYEELFYAIVFTVFDCGFVARSALEASNEANRLDRIIEIIKQSQFAIHDLSRAGVDKKTKLARFNMPFELGLFIGALKFGTGKQKQKNYLVLDREKFRHTKLISDLSGIDPKSHDNDCDNAIISVRNWIRTIPDISFSIPLGTSIVKRYAQFQKELPDVAKELSKETKQKINISDLHYIDYASLIQNWLKKN